MIVDLVKTVSQYSHYHGHVWEEQTLHLTYSECVVCCVVLCCVVLCCAVLCCVNLMNVEVSSPGENTIFGMR